MLTSSANQYLRPEYLTPLPTTLDAKKSPLALLAQTCSQIGADTSTTKNLLPSMDKKKTVSSESSARDKNSPASSGSSSTGDRSSKSHDTCKKDNGDHASTPEDNIVVSVSKRVRTPVSKSSSPSVGSPSPRIHVKSPSMSSSDIKIVSSDRNSTTPSSLSITTSSASSKLGFSSMLSDHALKDLPLGTFKPGLTGFPGPLGYPPGCHIPVDSVSTTTSLPASLMSHGVGLLGSLKPGLTPTSLALGPYLSYARLKTPSGGEALVPVCRDPYCTGCQLNASHMLKGACPSGCVQCDHQKNSFQSLAALMPGMSPSALGYSPPHSFLGGPLPYVCNWIQGDNYCGKRFASSEELLQHLRSHTNLNSIAESNPLSLLNPTGLPHHLLNPGALHRTYPTPPLSPLSSVRYHPYGKPLLPSLSGQSLGPGIPGFPAHPAMASYYSPYSIYGPRLGATGLHP